MKKRIKAPLFLSLIIVGFYGLALHLGWRGGAGHKEEVPKPETPAVWADSPIEQLLRRIEEQNSEQVNKRGDLIPLYEDLFRTTAAEHGIDWRILASMAYVESRFNAQAESNGGARGLMQIMSRTAKIYDVSVDKLYDAQTSIDISARYLLRIERMLKLPADVSQENRIAMILACYHGGIGRMFDAQRLATAEGESKYDWEALSRHLLSLRDPKVYKRPEVHHGYYRAGRYTVNYVRDVNQRYTLICEHFDKN